MTRRVIILRPQPGADATAHAARALGLETMLSPLFEIAPLEWTPPDPEQFDALMLTSANAARRAGPGLMRYAALPLFVVGEATAQVARAAGLTPTHIGTRDAAALVEDMRREGIGQALHLCGADAVAAEADGLSIQRIAVYHSRKTGDALGSLRPEDICLVHSPRAAARLAALVPPERRSSLSLIAISDATRDAAGPGWADAIAAPSPTDAAMLALAQELCHKPSTQRRTRPGGDEMDSEVSTPDQAPPPIAPPPPLYQPPARKSRASLTLVLLLVAFVGGIAATVWAVPMVKRWFDSNQDSAEQQPLANAAAPALAVAGQQTASALEARLATVSAKLDIITQQAADAGSHAGRAEALLIAFAARRALDRGAPLGYLEGELRLRFADAQPRAVATIINAAASPVTIPDLQMRLGELTSALAGADTKADWWDAARRELSSLIIVRKAGAPSPEPRKVVERAQMLLASGRVDAALAEIERMRNHDKADAWLQMARQYNEARRALDVIEAAAILEPKRIPIPASEEPAPTE